MDDRLVALPCLRLAAAQRLHPHRRPHLERLLAAARIDPVAAQQVGLDGSGEALRVDLALEAALALLPGVVAVADVPADLTRLRDPLLDISHRRTRFDERRARRLSEPATPPTSARGTTRAASIQRSTSTGSKRTNRPIFRYGTRRSSTSRRTNRAVTPDACRQAVDVEQRPRAVRSGGGRRAAHPCPPTDGERADGEKFDADLSARPGTSVVHRQRTRPFLLSQEGPLSWSYLVAGVGFEPTTFGL